MAVTAQIDVKINTGDGVQNVNQLNNEFEQSTKTLKSLREEADKLNKEIENVEIGTKAYNEFKTQLIAVNTELKNTELGMEALDNEQFASELKSVTGGLMDMAGGLVLVGVSGEGVEKIAQTFAMVEGASRIASGAIEAYSSGMKIANSVIAKAAAAHAAMAVVQTAGGNASIFAAAKMRILNLVMAANPVMLLVTGIGLLVGAFAMFSSSADDAKAEVDALADSMEDLNAEFAFSGKQIDDYTKIYMNQAKLRGASATELLEIERDAAQKKIDSEWEHWNNVRKVNQAIVNNDNSTAEQRAAATKLIIQADTRQIELKREASVISSDLELKNYEIQKAAAEKAQREREERNRKYKADQERKAAEAKAKAEKEAAEALARQTVWNDKLIAYYDAIEAERQANITDAREKELQEAANRYDDLTAIADAAGKSTTEMTEEYQRKINEINKKYDTEALNNKKLLEIETQLLNEETTKQLELNTATNEEQRLAIRKKYSAKLQELEIKRITIEADILLSNTKLTEEERAKIIADANAKIAAAKVQEDTVDTKTDAEKLTEKLALYQAYADKVAEIITKTTSFISEMNARTAAQAKSYLEDSYKESTIALKQQLDDRAISQEEYNAELARLDQQKAQDELALKRKTFEQQKKLQIVNATIQGIQAVLAAYASGAATPILGVVTGPIYAAIAGGFAAMQVGMIASQQFRAARGGIVPGDGPGNVDSVNALLAPGETVINSASSKAFMPLLSAINQSGGGIPLMPDMAVGGGSQIIKVYNEASNQPVQAYVTEQQVSGVQGRIKKIKNRSKLF